MKSIKNKKKINIDYSKEDFKDYYFLINRKEFLSFEALVNITLLLSSFNSNDSNFVETYNNKVLKSFKNHSELVFKNFVISWTKNSRFSFLKLVPIVTEKESTNIMANNFFQDSKNEKFNIFLKNLNILLWDFISKKNKFVEIIDGVILFLDPETKKLKIVFNELVFKD